MCVAAAGALAFGVLGTLAYGVWFNHDQRAYADAMAQAHAALGVTASATTAVLAHPARAVTPVANAQPAVSVEQSTAGALPVDASRRTAAPQPPGDEQGSTQATWSGHVTQPAGFAKDSAGTTTLAGTDANAANPSAATRQTPQTGVRTANTNATNAAGVANPSPNASPRNPRDARLAQQDRRGPPAGSRRKPSLFARMGSFFHRVVYRQHGNSSQQDIYSHP